MSSSSSKKRDRSMFEAVQQLDSQDAVRHLTTPKDLQRSKAAQSQTQIYHSLIECRILLQRSMLQQQQQQQQADDDNSNTNDDKAQKQCDQLLVHLLQARHKLSHPHDDDNSTLVDYHKLHQESPLLQEQIQSEYTVSRESWKNVLNRRHEQVRLHAGRTQFLRVLDASFWQQVESVVQHEKLRREQTTTFDDTKVYQQLLKDLLVTAVSGPEQPVAPPPRTTKKMVDRRASKGRKIRYTDMTKLANFTFPLSKQSSTTSGLDEDEWFRSLFGGAGNQSAGSKNM